MAVGKGSEKPGMALPPSPTSADITIKMGGCETKPHGPRTPILLFQIIEQFIVKLFAADKRKLGSQTEEIRHVVTISVSSDFKLTSLSSLQ